MSLKSLIKLLLPPILLKARKPKFEYGWFGDYSTWGDAQKECGGYDAGNILEKCKIALLKVKNGDAVYERDSVLFDKIEYSWPLLAGLLRCAAEHEGRLHVLDFGGSLGSSYYQNRSYLSPLKELSWNIVEQQHFVACGKEYFEDDVLKFYKNIETCLSERKINVLLLSSVLQYLENPYEWLKHFAELGIEYIIIDRTPFTESKVDLLTVQHVSPDIYSASLACWIFSRRKILDVLIKNKYNLIANFNAIDIVNSDFIFEGFIFKRMNR